MPETVTLDEADLEALRFCARLGWQRRAELRLTPAQEERVLLAWMAIGTPPEGEAASDLIAARRAADAKQATFDDLISHV